MLKGLVQRLFGSRGLRHDGARLELACITNTGLHREHNEDNLVFFGHVMPEEHQSLDEPLAETTFSDDSLVVAVLDGMGGELEGEGASYAAATSLDALAPSLDVSEEGMAKAFRTMQDAVRSMRVNRRLSTTGSTAVALACQGSTAVVGNLGDSKAFLMRGGKLTTLSVSHTDERLLRSLGIDRKPALTQYLGVDEQDAPIEPHVVGFGLRAGDLILLATDGLTDMVDEADIASELRMQSDVSAIVSRLCEMALDNGGEDNVTIIACRVAGPRQTGVTR